MISTPFIMIYSQTNALFAKVKEIEYLNESVSERYQNEIHVSFEVKPVQEKKYWEGIANNLKTELELQKILLQTQSKENVTELNEKMSSIKQSADQKDKEVLYILSAQIERIKAENIQLRAQKAELDFQLNFYREKNGNPLQGESPNVLDVSSATFSTVRLSH